MPLATPSPPSPLTCFLQGRLALQDNCLSFPRFIIFRSSLLRLSPLVAAWAISHYRSAPFPGEAKGGIPPQPESTDGLTQGRNHLHKPSQSPKEMLPACSSSLSCHLTPSRETETLTLLNSSASESENSPLASTSRKLVLFHHSTPSLCTSTY